MRIEQFSDEHGIYFRASEEAFLLSKEQVASIRKHIDELRELVLVLYMCSEFLCGRCKHGHGSTCDFDAENELRELGIEVDE